MHKDTARQFIESDMEKLSGTPVFQGTRVPVKNLFDYFEASDDLEEFLDDFPTVTRAQAIGVLKLYEIKPHRIASAFDGRCVGSLENIKKGEIITIEN